MKQTKTRITSVSNFIILLLGIIIALGIGPLHPITLIIYALFLSYIWIFRTKYVYLDILPCLFAILIFVVNYCYQNGVIGSVAFPSSVALILVLTNIILCIVYFFFNLHILKTNKRSDN